ncbi:MAG: hypothetical protein JSU77_05150 [Fidelibacterota bacterium]|nr:MAG: hypothetical protein JSU77_05150 [Candidatus Neomarinimicrobiota bacterium]
MSNNVLSGIEGKFPLPDFSEGENFLRQVRGGLRRRQRRLAFAVSAATTASAVLLFVLSFSAIQRQVDEELWQDYLLSEAGEELVDTQELDEFTWELYLESLMQEEDLDLLLEEILNLEGGEEWIQTIKLEG